MQSYENKPKDSSIGKRILLDFIDYLRYKIENDRLTMEEMDSIAKVIEENVPLYGTSEDFARFYSKSRESVKVTISRKMIKKPVRKVLYSFNLFKKIIPDSWKFRNE